MPSKTNKQKPTNKANKNNKNSGLKNSANSTSNKSTKVPMQNDEQSKKPKSINVSPRTTSQLQKMKNVASKPVKNRPLKESEPQNKKQVSEKTKELAKIIKEDNYRKIQKDKHTNQNKNEFNLKKLVDEEEGENENSSANENASGVIKKYDKNVKPSSMNSKSGIKVNVIGKKSDIKIFANKQIITIAVVLAILLLCSIISNFIFFTFFKFKADNPPISFTKEIRVLVSDSSVNLASVTIPRNVVTNMKVRQNIQVFSYLLNQPQVVRAKGYFTSGDGELYDVLLEFDEYWLQGEDGYYYFNKQLNSSESYSAVKFATVPKEVTVEINGKNLNVLTVVFESLNNNAQAVNLLWTTAPQEWLQEIF